MSERKTYIYGAYRLELDSSEIDPDNAGSGTPALLYGPHGRTATYWHALSSGECGECGDDIPDGVMRWLDRLAPTVDAFLERHGG